ncbi:septum formation family protein [Ruicaihuangia caeni]|uniref:septum formation family protein n=1 Tax=Ruicaihuangia caeni TaxID=3042517 RepID=UPI00338F6682
MSDARDPRESGGEQPGDEESPDTLDDVFGADAFREYPEEPIVPRLPLRESRAEAADEAADRADAATPPAPQRQEPATPAVSVPATESLPEPPTERLPASGMASPVRPHDAAPSAPEPPRPPVRPELSQDAAPEPEQLTPPAPQHIAPSDEQPEPQPPTAGEARFPFGEPLVPSAPVAPDEEPRRAFGRRLMSSAPDDAVSGAARRSTWTPAPDGDAAATVPDVIGAISDGPGGDPTGDAPSRRDAGSAGAGGVPQRQKVLLWVAGSLVAVLALLALFLLGTRIGAAQEGEPAEPAAPPAASEAPPEEEPETPLPVAGPVAPGTYEWDQLGGGECIDPYTNPWAEEFTVVDCATPHRAQLTVKQPFPEYDAAAPFPGTEALRVQLAALCSAPGTILLDLAGQYADIQIDGSFAVTEEQWDAGMRDYSCFVSRSSGEPIEGSLIP